MPAFLPSPSLLTSSASRVGNDRTVSTLVSELESFAPSTLSAADPRLLGVWRNLHTTVPSTSSAIQRFIIRNASFAPAVEQVVLGPPSGPPQRIVNRVDLRVALGAVLNVAATVESVEGRRLRVRFDEAWFAVSNLPAWLGGAEVGWRVPYPVPFRLLGEKAKGWLDVTYLDDELRVVRGNRGSAFVLQKRDARESNAGCNANCDRRNSTT